jgi:transcriptional regulator with XRE-family HTH domain
MNSVTTDILQGVNTGRPAKHERPVFGQRLAEAREHAGFTQQQLAERVGVDQRVITYWERRPVALRPEQLKGLADALGVTTDYLLDRATKLVAPKGPTGKVRQVFERVNQLPRQQQNKVVEFVEAFVNQHAAKAS